MLKIVRTTAISVLLCTLVACNTTQSSSDSTSNKKDATALINTQLGLSYLEKHEVQQAKQKLLLALDEAPNIPETWYSMAYFMEVTGNKTEAEKYYLKAIEIAPKKGEVQNNYGTFLCRTGDYSGAINHFLLAVQDPKYLDTASAYENAGLCAMKIPDAKLAMQYFNEAITQDPNHPTSLFELARFNYLQGNYAQAKEELHQFLVLSPPTPQSQWLSEKIAEKMRGTV